MKKINGSTILAFVKFSIKLKYMVVLINKIQIILYLKKTIRFDDKTTLNLIEESNVLYLRNRTYFLYPN